jgi:hypothetical protein
MAMLPLAIPVSCCRATGCTPLLCRRMSLPPLFLLSSASVSAAPFARPLLELATHLFALRPRVERLDAAHWGLQLIAWIHTVLHVVAVILWSPKRQKQHDSLPPTWAAEELGQRSSIERFFARTPVFLCLQRPPVSGWSTAEMHVTLTLCDGSRHSRGGRHAWLECATCRLTWGCRRTCPRRSGIATSGRAQAG